MTANAPDPPAVPPDIPPGEGEPVPVMDQILTDAIESPENPARRERTARDAAAERRPPAEGNFGGYALVARALNEVYDWPDGRVVTRQVVQTWDKRRTPNKAGQPPPLPVDEVENARRTTPRFVFDVSAWQGWVRAGVWAYQHGGWVCPSYRAAGDPPQPQAGGGSYRHGTSTVDHWNSVAARRLGTLVLAAGGDIERAGGDQLRITGPAGAIVIAEPCGRARSWHRPPRWAKKIAQQTGLVRVAMVPKAS